MGKLNIRQMGWSHRLKESASYVVKKRGRIRVLIGFFCICIPLSLICGCSHFSDEYKARSILEEANILSSQGNYQASLNRYEGIIKQSAIGDRVLFEMGMIHAHPQNEQKDFQKALACFQNLIRRYPGSEYRQDSEMMIFYIRNVTIKDGTIMAQQQQNEILRHESTTLRQEIATLRHEAGSKETEITMLKKKIETLEQKISSFAILRGPADRILIEKKQRRLTLFSKGEALKTYKIALGGNPDGPKEQQGDNKTPEGTYFIDSKNRDSLHYRSLHISYPNERDKKRAKELGVSPGGDIMIHGIKNGFSWVGDMHTTIDWTKGCVAVTDEEIEEIDQLVPPGTIVEILP